MKIITSPIRDIADFEGLQFLSRQMSGPPQLYQQVLGKPHKTLLSHSLDAGFICEFLLNCTIYQIQAKHLTTHTGLTQQQLSDALSYLCAMHDTGKLHPYFQAKLFDADPSVQEPLEQLYGSSITGFHGYRHEIGSEELLLKILKEKDPEAKHGRNWRALGAILSMHHQGFHKGCKADIMLSFKDLPAVWDTELVQPFLTAIDKTFPVDVETLFKLSHDIQTWVFSTILGVVMTCDWIASSSHFTSIDLTSDCNIAAYKSQIFDIMDKWVHDVDLTCRFWNDTYSYQNLFYIDAPRPMQNVVATAVSEHPLFDCMLIEAPMGEGKSEAALYTAINTLKNRNLQGIYFALPTGLTAEAMHPRLKEMLRNIGEDDDVKLSTSTAWLSDLYDETIQQEMLLHRCKFLDRFCVGTVDQIMQAAELTYYAELKMLALGAKVIVIDEIHSYDAYMLAVIKVMLQYFKAMSVPVIMLSATLSRKAKDQLLEYYNINNTNYIGSYPAISVVDNGMLYQYKCLPSSRSATIDTSVQHDTLSSFYQQAVAQVQDGGCLVFVVNSVQNAKKSYCQIARIVAEQQSDIQLYLMHARLPMTTKEQKINELTTLFGKDRSQRPKKAIVIATPIIEMSIDLDFDFMYRQIAPIDAIMQSLGRVARHDDAGTIRETGIKPSVVVMDTPSGNRIYAGSRYRQGDDIPILSVTAEILDKHNVVHLPQDIPVLVDKVYNDARLDDYYHDQQIKEMAGQVNVSKYDIDQIVTGGNMKDSGKQKIMLAPTRQNSVPYVPVAVVTDAQLEALGSKDLKQIRQVYKDTVVSIPAYMLNPDDKLPLGEDLDDISPWFSDVYIDHNGKVFTLDLQFGLERNDANSLIPAGKPVELPKTAKL